MKKLLVALLSVVSIGAYSNELSTEYETWTKSERFGGYISPELVNGNFYGVLKVNKDFIQFGFLIPYDQCYFKESHPEPFGSIYVLGGDYNFSMMCLEKDIAVVFPTDNYASVGIVNSLAQDGNVCFIAEGTKFCFAGKGVSGLVSDTGFSN
ncbi:hypothetical protein FCV50_13255 [Vibrio kanaloae]|uniref:Uncharacterized protein n=1 Tax=Vibrio kanaloae TaxID=170673 RepID=A0A4V5R7S1_9VIBR|nr:hypothetical protein [Vibrio kanaloae]TKF30768.1 hypothetical protein FCV50_13255 [Vibrio kanaloae]